MLWLICAGGGGRCYCGNELRGGKHRVNEKRCQNVCIADFSQICGGSGVLSLYEANDDDEGGGAVV